MTNQVLVTCPPLNVYFLPHISDFLTLVDDELGNFPKLIQKIADKDNLKAPDIKTLRKAQIEPVTLSTAQHINRIYRSGIPETLNLSDLELKTKPWRHLRLKNNGISWISGLSGLEQSSIGKAIQGSHAVNFILTRIEQERSFLEWMQGRMPEAPDKSLDSEALVQQAQDFLLQKTNVDPELVSLLTNVDFDETDRDSASWSWGQSVAKMVNHQLRVDFYYSFLCELTLDIARYLASHDLYEAYKERIIDWGCVGDIAPAWDLPNREDNTPFVRLLGAWKERLSELNGREFGWREMASYLPSPRGLRDEQVSSQEGLQENKYAWLKKWRRGDAVPQQPYLDQFIARLCKGQEADHYLGWMRAHIALAWGKLIEEEMATVNGAVANYPMLTRFNALWDYQKYWARYQEQAAAIAAT